MNGYLQCLIDQYDSKVRKAIEPDRRNIYREVLNDLLKFKEYVEKPKEETIINNVPRKYVVTGFKGDMPGFIEYLKNLRRGE